MTSRRSIGVWAFSRDWTADTARLIEDAGFSSLWLGGGPSPTLRDAERLLEATSTLRIATGITVIWQASPKELTVAWRRVSDRFGERFTLGLGTGHAPRIGPHDEPPYAAMVRYLDGLEAAGLSLPSIVLAALGPRMLRLAAQRTAGAHPYLVDPAYVSRARAEMGEGPLLIPEQRVVLGPDAAKAREIARASIASPYLGLPNYRNNFARSGFDATDLAGRGSDRLIDSLSVSEAAGTIESRIEEFFGSGADEVLLQVLQRHPGDAAATYRHLARIVGLD